MKRRTNETPQTDAKRRKVKDQSTESSADDQSVSKPNLFDRWSDIYHVKDCTTREQINQFKSPDLRAFLGTNGLKKTGAKADLVDRIYDAITAVLPDPKLKREPFIPIKQAEGLFSTIKPGTLLGRVLPELFPGIIMYYLCHKRIQARGIVHPYYIFESKAGGSGTLPNKFQTVLYGSSMDGFGNVYLNGQPDHIPIFTPEGKLLQKLPFSIKKQITAQAISHPCVLAFGAFDGNMIVTQTLEKCTLRDFSKKNDKLFIYDANGKKIKQEIVRKIKKSDNYQRKLSHGGSNDSEEPDPKDAENTPYWTGAAIDRDGNIVLRDCRNGNIKIYDSTGTTCLRVICPPEEPQGDRIPRIVPTNEVAVDLNNGNIIAAEDNGRTIRTYSSTGEVLGSFGEGGSDPHQLGGPCAIAVDRIGNIIVADQTQHLVKIFSPEGKLLSYFGNDLKVPREERLNMPCSVAIDSEGNLTIVEYSYVVKFRGSSEPPVYAPEPTKKKGSKRGTQK